MSKNKCLIFIGKEAYKIISAIVVTIIATIATTFVVTFIDTTTQTDSNETLEKLNLQVPMNVTDTSDILNYVTLPITGPSDVGGYCPTPSYQYKYLIGNNGADACCCSGNCCWDKCTLSDPPKDCLQGIPNSQWFYDNQLGHYQAYVTTSGK